MGRALTIALVVLLAGVMAWALADLLGEDEDFTEESARVVVLAEGADWQLVLTSGPALEYRTPGSTASAREYTTPITLNEAGAYAAERGGTRLTLVAGPVADAATSVEVKALDGTRGEAALIEAFGLKWFWAELEGWVRVSEIVARDQAGSLVDEYTHPPMPPPFEPSDP